MHEASLAMNIVDILTDEMKKHPESKLNKVFIDIGEFTHIDPEALQFAYDVIKEDSGYSQSSLEIKRIPLLLGCTDCKTEFSSKEMLFKCPECESRNVEILTGREFRITELEVD